VDSLEFSPDGKNVFFGDGTENACIWDVANSKQTTCLHLNHDARIHSYKFSSDGQYVASASSDRSARIWETATGTEIARKIHESEVFSVAFSPDGKYMLSATGSGIVRRWLWQQADLMADACARLTRNLTRAEWEQFIGDAMPYPSKQEDATCPNLPLEPEITPIPIVTP
jgi:WD40 repeat protein